MSCKIETWWQNTFRQSLLLGGTLSALDSVKEKLKPSTGKVGSLLQKLAFLIVLALFLAIGMPQFANDKMGLALITLISVFLWVLGYLLGGEEKRELSHIDLLVLSLMGINIICAFSSHYLMASLKGLAKVIVYIGSYFLFTAVLQASPKRRLIVLFTLLLNGLALAFYGFYQYKIGVAPLATWEDPSVEGGGGTRIFATMGNPNLLAGFFTPLVPISLGLSLYFIDLKKYIPAAASILLCGALVLAIVFTGCRGAYIALGACLMMFGLCVSVWAWKYLPAVRKYLPVMFLAIIVALALVVWKVPQVQERIGSMFSGRDHSSNSYRMNVWIASLHMFAENWWLGIGVGNEAFRLAYGLYMVSGFDALGTYCVPLEIAVENGIAGVLIFGLLVGLVLLKAHHLFWDKEQNLGAWRFVVLGLAGAVFALMVHGMVDTVFYRPQVHFIFWLCVSLIALPWNTYKEGNIKINAV
ncbi:MAG: O-antigen ligase family protein [Candidatus Melainabacteria bacterium]|nr:O-antigen ligase family protein [Candidatus Melainabacteria bacterium]